MRAQDIMTPSPAYCSPDDTVSGVARIMREYDCGAVPIVDPETHRLVGIVTDRDLAIRGLASDRSCDTKVSELMTRNPHCCNADDDVRSVESAMAENQIRRVPVIDSAGCCVGIVAQADLARAAAHGSQLSDREVAIVVERISEPRARASNPGFDKGLTAPRKAFREAELRARDG